MEHFEKYTDLNVISINPRDRKEFLLSLALDLHDVYVVHWQVIRLLPELENLKWFHIIADECHALQNRKAQQTIAFKEIQTIYKTGLSGTPAFDKPDDLWSILNWLYPDFWPSYWRYYEKHVLYVDNDGYRVVVGIRNSDDLLNEMRSFYVRRRKEDVLLDLPDKYNSTTLVDLGAKQTRAYNQMRDHMLAWVGEHEDEPVVAPIVIAQLQRLQQLSDAFGEVKDDKFETAEPSAKLDALMQIINSTNEQIVVFSQYNQIIRLLEKRLIKNKITHGIFTGQTTQPNRKKIIDDFQSGKLKVFAGTISAGGVGITLTASSTVVFIDRSWSPSLNVQAEDRLHRIGQNNAVHVIDLISRSTIDAKRIKKINLKWSWIRKLIGDPVDEDDFGWDGEEVEPTFHVS